MSSQQSGLRLNQHFNDEDLNIAVFMAVPLADIPKKPHQNPKISYGNNICRFFVQAREGKIAQLFDN